MCSVVAGLTALAGYSQYRGQQEQANAQAAAYRAQADAAEQNARIEGKKQEQLADSYATQAKQLQERRRIIAGQQRAQAGSAGLDMAGSALDILSSGYDAYNQDQMTLLSNQRNDNYNSRVAQSNYLNQAAGARAAASNVKANARAQGLSTILGTAASIYGMKPWERAAKPAGTVSSNIGYNTTSTWSAAKNAAAGNGYTFTQTKPLYTLGTQNFFQGATWQLNPNQSRSMFSRR